MRKRLSNAGTSLRVRNYRLYFIGQSVSVAGTFMQMLALSFLVLKLTGSGADLGIMAGARLLPFVLLGPAGGLIADRYDKRKLLYLTQTSLALGALAFAILSWTGSMTFGLVVILQIVVGCFTVLDNPARQSFISELVTDDALGNAVALNSIAMNISRIFGAMVGGALVAAVGIPWCFAINAISFIAVLVSLAMMRTAELYPSVPLPRRRGQIREGLAYAVKTPELALPLAAITVTGILAFEFPVTLPLVATGAFRGNAGTYGVMAAVMAVGSILGGFVTASRAAPRSASTLAATSIFWGAAILAVAVSPTLWVALLALPFVGYGTITFNATAKTILQMSSRPDMRGRVMALWAISWIGSTVIGGPIVGWVAEEFGSRWSLVVGGVPTIALGLALLPVLRRIKAADATGSVTSRPAEPARP